MNISQFTCRICSAVGNHPTFVAREMMFGTRETFPYFQCVACSCLQIVNIPSDLSKYYPAGYYSYSNSQTGKQVSAFTRLLQKQRIRTALFGKGYKLNTLLKLFVNYPKQLYEYQWPKLVGKPGFTSFDEPILDVGCGSTSWWLTQLWQIGFTNLTGIDPFIPNDTQNNGACIYKKNLEDLGGKFQLISFHHSLEHIPQQLTTLKQVKRLLAADGICLIRIPIVSSYVWEKYKTNWVEMDPPRHLYLHSVDSICRCASKAGLRLIGISYDAIELEFFGSEQYIRDIPLFDPRSLAVNPESNIFSLEEKAFFRHEVERVNREKTAGRAEFLFVHADP